MLMFDRSRCLNFQVLIDRGTPNGFKILAEAREQILGLDADLLKPKPKYDNFGNILPEEKPTPPEPAHVLAPVSILCFHNIHKQQRLIRHRLITNIDPYWQYNSAHTTRSALCMLPWPRTRNGATSRKKSKGQIFW